MSTTFTRCLLITAAAAAVVASRAACTATELDALVPGRATVSEVRAQFGAPVAKGTGPEAFERYEAREKGYKRVDAWYDEGAILVFTKVELVQKLSPAEVAALFTLRDTAKSAGGDSFTGETEGRTESYTSDGVHFWIADDVVREIWITAADARIGQIAETVQKTRAAEIPQEPAPAPVATSASAPAMVYAPASTGSDLAAKTPEAPATSAPAGSMAAAGAPGGARSTAEAPKGNGAVESPVAWLGVYVVEVGGKSAKSTGVRIAEVEKGSPAAVAGLAEGDVLYSFDGKSIMSADALVSAMAARRPFEQVKIEYIRKAKRSTVFVQLGRRWPSGEKSAEEPGKLGDIGVVLAQVSTEIAKAKKLPAAEGAYITETIKGREAEKAGLKSGDVITGFAGAKVARIEDFRKLLSATPPGTTVGLDIWRDGKAGTTEVTVGEMR